MSSDLRHFFSTVYETNKTDEVKSGQTSCPNGEKPQCCFSCGHTASRTVKTFGKEGTGVIRLIKSYPPFFPVSSPLFGLKLIILTTVTFNIFEKHLQVTLKVNLKRAMTRFQFSLWASEVMWEGFIEQVRLAVRGEPLERQELKRMTQWQMMCVRVVTGSGTERDWLSCVKPTTCVGTPASVVHKLYFSVVFFSIVLSLHMKYSLGPNAELSSCCIFVKTDPVSDKVYE